jgi:hypothetical protein
VRDPNIGIGAEVSACNAAVDDRFDLGEALVDDLFAVDAAEMRIAAVAYPNGFQQRTRRVPARGYAQLYRRSVLQADQGCDFDFLRGRGDYMSDFRVHSVFWARGCAPLRRGCTACGGTPQSPRFLDLARLQAEAEAC